MFTCTRSFNIFAVSIAIAFSQPVVGWAKEITFPNAKYSSDETPPTPQLSGILEKPPGKGPFPAIVLLHTCGGLSSHVTHDWPKCLTGAGYATLTVDSFGSRDLEKCPNDLWRKGRKNRNFRELVRDAYAGLQYLADQSYVDKNRIGVMGFSLGTLTITNGISGYGFKPGNRQFRAAVGLYGHCRHRKLWRLAPFPIMIIQGGRENSASLQSCQSAASNPLVEAHVLPGAYHAFDHEEIRGTAWDANGNEMLYDKDATNKARELTKAFFAKHLNKSALDPDLDEKKEQPSDMAKLLKKTVLEEAGGFADYCGNRRNGRRALMSAARQKLDSNGVLLPRGLTRQVGQALRVECRSR